MAFLFSEFSILFRPWCDKTEDDALMGITSLGIFYIYIYNLKLDVKVVANSIKVSEKRGGYSFTHGCLNSKGVKFQVLAGASDLYSEKSHIWSTVFQAAWRTEFGLDGFGCVHKLARANITH